MNSDGSSRLHYVDNGFSSKDDVLKFLDDATKEDGIYEIYYKWKEGGAHVFTYIKDGMKRKAYDPQTGWSRKIGQDLNRVVLDHVSIIKIDNSFVNTKLCKAFTKVNKTTNRN